MDLIDVFLLYFSPPRTRSMRIVFNRSIKTQPMIVNHRRSREQIDPWPNVHNVMPIFSIDFVVSRVKAPSSVWNMLFECYSPPDIERLRFGHREILPVVVIPQCSLVFVEPIKTTFHILPSRSVGGDTSSHSRAFIVKKKISGSICRNFIKRSPHLAVTSSW